MKRAMFPGSFDPITIGHCEIIKKACEIISKNTEPIIHEYLSKYKI